MNALSKAVVLILILVLSFSLVSCYVRDADKGDFYSFTDDLGREVKLDNPPTRVAILFSSYAEIWQIAGGNVAITVADSIDRGFAAESAVVVDGGAGHTTLDAELLVASSPDFVVGTADYPIQVETCEQLSSCGIPTALFRVDAFDDYLNVLKIFTDILGTDETYEKYGLEVKSKIDAYRDTVLSFIAENPSKKQKMLFIRAGSSPRSTKAKKASDNFACAMLEELGVYNIADSAPVLLDGLSAEEIVLADPDRIFISVMGEDEQAVKNNVAAIFSNDGYSGLKAVAAGSVDFLPKDLFHYKPNHRWAEAYLYLINIIYPEIEL